MRLSRRPINLTNMLRKCVPGLAALALICLPAGPAAAQLSDDQCLTGFVCTAGDVGLHQLLVIDVLEPCTGPGDTGTVNFRISAHNNIGGLAYDIGVYIATNGDDVGGAGATCYHTYLAPPLDATLVFPTDYGDFDMDGIFDIYRPLGGVEPFFDSDTNSCGDLDALSEVIMDFGPVTIACADEDMNGVVDVSVGFSNKQNPVACTGVAEAVPGTVSKCTSSRYNLDGLDVIPVELMSFSIE